MTNVLLAALVVFIAFCHATFRDLIAKRDELWLKIGIIIFEVLITILFFTSRGSGLLTTWTNCCKRRWRRLRKQQSATRRTMIGSKGRMTPSQTRSSTEDIEMAKYSSFL